MTTDSNGLVQRASAFLMELEQSLEQSELSAEQAAEILTPVAEVMSLLANRTGARPLVESKGRHYSKESIEAQKARVEEWLEENPHLAPRKIEFEQELAALLERQAKAVQEEYGGDSESHRWHRTALLSVVPLFHVTGSFTRELFLYYFQSMSEPDGISSNGISSNVIPAGPLQAFFQQEGKAFITEGGWKRNGVSEQPAQRIERVSRLIEAAVRIGLLFKYPTKVNKRYVYVLNTDFNTPPSPAPLTQE